MFVIGTAGHIDHGKSSIINRLTGIDPDRLPEEKQRGMTIDLGFAWYDTADGNRIGIVDVPGHERFVRNMIAGAGGIDAVILVVAADDGWMPQTQEHFQITRLLGIKYGIVALSKVDLVESSWVDLVEEDLKERLKGTYLENAPIVRVSSVTREGFDRLKEEIDMLSRRIVEREDIGKPRLYIDRSFVLSGMGGVVTGSLRGGTLKAGQEVSVFPARKNGRVRSLQSHNNQMDISYPGQRTAASLTGVDKEYLVRGGVITLPEVVSNYPQNPVLALSLTLLDEATIILADKRRLLMILGTTEIEGEIRIMKSAPISPGHHDIVFFRPFGDVLAFIGDRFIVRLPTPQVTVGGGTVLGIFDFFPRKKDMADFDFLCQREEMSPERLVSSELSRKPFFDLGTDLLHSNFSQGEMRKAVEDLFAKNILAEHKGKYYRPADLEEMTQSILSGMESYFEKRPHTDGLLVSDIAALVGRSSQSLEAILELMSDSNKLVKKKNRFDLPGRAVTVKGELQILADRLEKELLAGGFSPPSAAELVGEDRQLKEAFEYLLLTGKIVKVAEGIVFHKDVWLKIIGTIKGVFDKGEVLSVGNLREKLGSSRKYVVPILEETDRLGITERQGDIRIKGANYEKR